MYIGTEQPLGWGFLDLLGKFSESLIHAHMQANIVQMVAKCTVLNYMPGNSVQNRLSLGKMSNFHF